MDPTQSVWTTPAGTYFVAYPGTIAVNEIVTIPNKHRREGDSQDNPQVRVIIQNIPTDPSEAAWQQTVIEVVDNTNTSCAYIYAPNAWQLETDTTLKMIANTFTYHATALFRVIVFYKKP